MKSLFITLTPSGSAESGKLHILVTLIQNNYETIRVLSIIYVICEYRERKLDEHALRVVNLIVSPERVGVTELRTDFIQWREYCSFSRTNSFQLFVIDLHYEDEMVFLIRLNQKQISLHFRHIQNINTYQSIQEDFATFPFNCGCFLLVYNLKILLTIHAAVKAKI